MYMQQQAA